MFYVPYVDIVGERGFNEMRSATVQNSAKLPAGNYGFLELYCSDPDCDCRRLLIQVLREDTADRVWATINYGFASPEFYGEWIRDAALGAQLSGLSLEPMGPQSEYAIALLALFRDLLEAPEYAARLKRHYDEVKQITSAASGPLRGSALSEPKPLRRSGRRSKRGA